MPVSSKYRINRDHRRYQPAKNRLGGEKLAACPGPIHRTNALDPAVLGAGQTGRLSKLSQLSIEFLHPCRQLAPLIFEMIEPPFR